MTSLIMMTSFKHVNLFNGHFQKDLIAANIQIIPILACVLNVAKETIATKKDVELQVCFYCCYYVLDWSSGIMICVLFTLENIAPLMR